MKNKNLIPAYLLTFVNVLGFSIMIPVFPFIIKDVNAPYFVYGLVLSIYSFAQFIGSPLLGKLSDYKGRRPILLISQLGTLVSWVIFGIAYFVPYHSLESFKFTFFGTTYFLSLPIMIIIMARISDGITGGNTSVTNAYVADITTFNQKKTIFGYLGGIAGIAFVIGPGIGGITASSSLGYLGTVITASIISIIALAAIYFFLKESLPQEKRRPYEKPSIKDMFFIVKRVRTINPKPIIKQILRLRILFAIAMAFFISTVILYLIDLFGFNEKGVGLFMLIAGLFLGFNQTVVYRKVVFKFGELRTLGIGFTLMFIGFIAITLTNNLIIYVFLYYILNLGISITIPIFNSLISQHADEDKQGELMGISESIASLTNAVIPIFASGLYAIISYNIYYLIAIFPLLGAYFTFKLLKNKKAK